jgi:hypothetical protein
MQVLNTATDNSSFSRSYISINNKSDKNKTMEEEFEDTKGVIRIRKSKKIEINPSPES